MHINARTRRRVLATTALLVVSVVTCVLEACSSDNSGNKITLILGGYTTPREAYGKAVIPAFQKYWKEKTGQDRVFDLNDVVEASPYREVQDSPEVLHTFQMVQAKLAGFILPVKEALARYPESDTSEPARYAHAMVYMRQPNFQKALAAINSLIAEEPENPYFYEARGQIYVSLAKPALAIPDYQKSVSLRPQAPQLRLALATAQLATDNPSLAPTALQNLKAALLVEDGDPFT